MDVLNMNAHQVSVRCKGPANIKDYVTVAPKRRVTLPEGYAVDNNWLAQAENVSVFADKTAKSPIVLQASSEVAIAPASTQSAPAPTATKISASAPAAPAPSPAA